MEPDYTERQAWILAAGCRYQTITLGSHAVVEQVSLQKEAVVAGIAWPWPPWSAVVGPVPAEIVKKCLPLRFIESGLIALAQFGLAGSDAERGMLPLHRRAG